jgi:hypothetical protein
MRPGKSNAPKASVSDDLDFTSTPAVDTTSSKKEVKEVETVSASSDDEYDSLFSDL